MTPGGTVAGGGAIAPDPGCGTTAIMLSPDGKALFWASPQALDSFQVIYDGDYGGHRADTLALDLISAALKPDSFAHTPLDFNSAQIRTWDVFLAPLPTRLAGAAVIAAQARRCMDGMGWR